MSTEDEAAREARAKRLREQIDIATNITKPEEAETQKKETPHEFVQRRMQEIAQAEAAENANKKST